MNLFRLFFSLPMHAERHEAQRQGKGTVMTDFPIDAGQSHREPHVISVVVSVEDGIVVLELSKYNPPVRLYTFQ